MASRDLVATAVVALALVGCRDRGHAAPADAGRRDATLAATIDAGPRAVVKASPIAPLDAILAAHPEATTLDDVPRLLPPELLRSFVLKHGRERAGERGHLVERRISQSADPEAPRAILWDERTGLVLSYNGGLPTQKNGQRLDIHSFDEASRTFGLWGIEFPIAGGRAAPRTTDCATCHGPRSRPIFSMYPDWPGFYGSDNDELTNARVAVQVAELADYRRFRRDVAPKHPRYRPLFPAGDEAAAGEAYPYRPDVREDIHALSRAFAFRPGLRLGIVLNRLQARSLVAHVVQHPRHARLGRTFLASLVGCALGDAALAPVRKEIEAVVGAPLKLVGGALHYRQAWKLFDLDVRDVDIRYAYTNEGYASDDASRNPMAVGYIGTYWNSYFDGSATIDELVAYGLYEEEAKRTSALVGVVQPNGLRRKYEGLTERYRVDERFFLAMDASGLWLPIPYPAKLNAVHHREGFGAEYRRQHEVLCRILTTPSAAAAE